MIITLKGANFSGNNIGTLDMWFITLDIKGVTSSNTATSVKKGEAWSTTFTIKDGYTIDENSTFTVDGVTQALTWSSSEAGGTATFSFTPSKNTSIVLKATSTGSSGGEEEEPTTTTKYLFKDQTNIGYLRGGEFVSSTKAATTDYIDISNKPKIGYFGRMGYVEGDTFHALEFYDENKNYISSLSVLGTGAPMYTNLDLSDSKYQNAKFVRASVSQSSYTQEQFDSWYFIVGEYVEEEKTVTDMFPELGYIDLNGAIVDATSNAYYTDYVSTAGHTTIEYKGRMGTIGLNMAFYDSNKNHIDSLKVVGTGNFITLNINLTESQYSNVAYVRASVSRGTLDEATWNSSSFKIS